MNELIKIETDQKLTILRDRQNPEKRVGNLDVWDVAALVKLLYDAFVSFYGIDTNKITWEPKRDLPALAQEIKRSYYFLTPTDFDILTSHQYLRTLDGEVYGRFSIQNFYNILDEYKLHSRELMAQAQRQLQPRQEEAGSWEEQGTLVVNFLEKMKEEYPDAAKKINGGGLIDKLKSMKDAD